MSNAALAEAENEGPERTCIVTREKHSPDDMIRFVLGPDSAVVPDLRRKLPGRGVWVSCSSKTVAEAVRKQAFGRGFKTQAKASDHLAADVEALLERDALQGLSIANKASLIVSGAAKVEAAIEKNAVLALIHATDGSADGIRKLDQALTRRFGDEAKAVEKLQLFASAQLDLALGRTNVIHAAVKRGAAGDLFLFRCRRLATYRSSGPFATAAPTADGIFETLAGSGQFASNGGRGTIGSSASEPASVANELSNGLGPGIGN